MSNKTNTQQNIKNNNKNNNKVSTKKKNSTSTKSTKRLPSKNATNNTAKTTNKTISKSTISKVNEVDIYDLFNDNNIVKLNDKQINNIFNNKESNKPINKPTISKTNIETNSIHNNKKSTKKIKMRPKKYLFILLGIIPIVLISLLIFINLNKGNNPDDGLKYNNNKTFIKEQKVSGIVFRNIKCTYDGKDSIISYTMINETKKEIYLDNYDVIVKDKNNVRLTKITAHVTQTIGPNGIVSMANQVVGVDLTDAYYMELFINAEK